MYSNLTIEEENIIAMYAGENPSRRIVIDAIKGVMRFIGDYEMVRIARNTLDKVERMSEGEFYRAIRGVTLLI